MRSIVWLAPAAIGAALMGLVATGGADRASAQGMMMGESPRKAAPHKAAKRAAKPKRYYYRGAAAGKTCGQFKYLSKGKCLDARTAPPKL